MQISTVAADPLSVEAEWLAVGLFEGESATSPEVLPELISRLTTAKDLAGTLGETLPLHGTRPDGRSVLIFGLGKRDDFREGSAFSAGVSVSKKLSSKPRGTVAIALPSSGPATNSAIVQGLIVGMEGTGIRKSEPNRHPFGQLTLVVPPGSDTATSQAAVDRGQILGDSINLARQWVNTPPSDKPPVVLADRAEALAQELGLEVEVWGPHRLKAERFGGVLAVASGSANEARFVRIRYRKGVNAPMTAFVGKGVTFDSGGLSLKPSASMEDMKCDMAGAATVLAALQAIVKLQLPVNLDVSFAFVENMTGGDAMKLGDVLTMRNGLTVEVLNTDAEGRLILADVLSYANESNPARIINLATLTGACLVALGTKIAGLFSNNDEFASEVAAAARTTGERVWRMPLDDDFGDAIKSKVAEIKNTGNKWGGAITAAKFLQRFVGETPWVHLDIAGPAWADDDSATRDPGGTGYFVRTLVALMEGSIKQF